MIPYDDYVAMLTKNTEGDSVPREVAEKAILEAMPLIKEWRLPWQGALQYRKNERKTPR